MAKLIDITGKAISGEWGTDDPDGTGIRVLRTTNFTNDGVVDYNDVVTRKIAKKNMDSKYLRHGDIIIEKSGGSDKQPVGRVIYFEGPEQTYLFNNFTGLLRVRDQNTWLPRYVFYSLFSNYLAGGTRAYENRTTGLHNLQTDSYISSFEVRPVSIEKQAEICSNLDKIIHIISLKKKQISKMDELVKSRFVEMFGKNEFEQIPFDSVCEFLRNGASVKQTKGAGGYPITRIETLANDVFNPDRLGYANITDLDGFERYILQKGDILISHINSVAYLGRAIQYRGEVNTSVIHGMNLLCARLKKGYNSTYVEHFFKTPMAKDYISTITKKAVNQASITTTDLKKMPIPAPPLVLQNQFSAFVAEVDKSKLAVKQSLEKLETLKKSLMQQYFGG